ncbi:MAG TPA: CBS domain-containing protein [Gammaproteobacteria bacterium]|nr:CBS domain-containing protein [Gammaproteobacteria bacterium]
MNVGDVCNRIVITVQTTDTVRHAAELMRKYHVGNLVVTDRQDGRMAPIGVVTDRDIVVEAVAKKSDPDHITVGNIMTGHPLVAHELDSVVSTLDAMSEVGVRRVPVMNDADALVGVLALDDLFQLLASQIHNMAAIVGTQRLNESKTRL